MHQAIDLVLMFFIHQRIIHRTQTKCTSHVVMSGPQCDLMELDRFIPISDRYLTVSKQFVAHVYEENINIKYQNKRQLQLRNRLQILPKHHCHHCQQTETAELFSLKENITAFRLIHISFTCEERIIHITSTFQHLQHPFFSDASFSSLRT